MNKPKRNDASSPTDRQPVEINISAEIQKGVHSNVALIHHTKNEFMIDFLLQFESSAQVVSRVILSTEQARLLELALKDNIKKYDDKFAAKRKRSTK